MRSHVDYRTTERRQYNSYKELFPESTTTFEQWKDTIYDFSYRVRDYILQTGEKVKLPWGFGDLTVSKRKTRNTKKLRDGRIITALPIDWKKTKEKGKYIYNFNYHTEGYRFKWYWFLSTARFLHSELWNFRASRKSSRKITEYLNIPDKGYIDLYRESIR